MQPRTLPAPENARYNLRWAHCLDEIQPVDGWSLWSFPWDDGDGFTKAAYFARGPERDEKLNVSLYRFSPTQERFHFLVKNGFPKPTSPFGPWDDTEIDHVIEYGWPRAAKGTFPYAGHRDLASIDSDAA